MGNTRSGVPLDSRGQAPDTPRRSGDQTPRRANNGDLIDDKKIVHYRFVVNAGVDDKESTSTCPYHYPAARRGLYGSRVSCVVGRRRCRHHGTADESGLAK